MSECRCQSHHVMLIIEVILLIECGLGIYSSTCLGVKSHFRTRSALDAVILKYL